MGHAEYKVAVLQNDEAHRRAIRTLESVDVGDKQDAFQAIQDEAKMWLRHLFSIHHPMESTSCAEKHC